MRTISATIDLEASPETVWNVLTNQTEHSAWNPFITKMSGTLEVGNQLTIRSAPPGGKPMTFHPTVTDFQPAERLAWLGHLGVPRLFDGAQSFELTPLPGGRTRMVQTETFSGALVWMFRGVAPKTAAGFDAMHQALAQRISHLPRTPLST